MASRRPSVATTFLSILGLGALAVAIVAIALSFTASASESIGEAERDYAAIDLLANRHAVSSLLAAEEAATVIDQINGPESLVAEPLTAQRRTTQEASLSVMADLGDRVDSVGAEALRWSSGMNSAIEPTSIDEPFDQLVAYDSIIDVACCSGIVPSDEHHIDELRDLEAAALVPAAAWDYFYIAVEMQTRRNPGIPASVSRLLQHRGTPERLAPDGELPSEMLATELDRYSTLGVSQEAVNTLLAGEPINVLDNIALNASGRGSVVVSSEEAYAAADATYRSLNELFAISIESNRERLMREIESAEQTELVTRILAPLLLVILAGIGFVTYRFARNREQALQREQDLLDARNRFMRMVSHELRTPATAISGFAEMLGSDWTSLTETEIAEFLAIINRQSTHLSLIVDDLLTLSHLETGRLRLHLSVVNLKQAADDAISMVDARYGIEVETTIDPSLTLLADPDRLVQILRNLVENAAKYGKVGVSVSAAVVGRGCEIVVSDTGPGVPPEQVKRIFRFWDRGSKDGSRVRGYGMGLAIARHLARAMVGDLIYRPHEPVGSEFVLSLPLGPPDAITSAVPEAETDQEPRAVV